MAKSSAMASALLILLFIAPAIRAAEHVVGGNAGWTLGQNYQTWAASRTFVVGDTLVFRYDNTHTVQIVNQEDYNDCDPDDDNQTSRDGNTTITLQNPGPMYFICTTPTHCARNQKLTINVQAAGAAPRGSPAGPTTPSPSGSTTPTTPGTSSVPTTPQSNGGASIFGENHVMIVVSSMVASMLMFMS